MNSNVIVIPAKKADVSEQKLRTAAYCRVSSDSADQLNSYMAQVRYYEKFLSESDTAILVNVYADEGITGTRMDKRDEFLRMLRDCRKGKIDRIITKSVSRFARNTKECLSVIRELKELGITIMFEKEGIDTANISDEMMITIMGGLAQEESISLSQNVRWGINQKMRNGTFKISNPPFGFNVADGKLTINELEAEIVRTIYSLYINGNGVQQIAKLLNEKKILGKNQKICWTAYTICNILKNERYYGDAVLQKFYVTETFPHIEKKNKGEKERYYIFNSNSPIITKEEYDITQQLMKRKKIEYSYKSRCFSKKIYCANCGASFKYKKRNVGNCLVCRRHDISIMECKIKPISDKMVIDLFISMYNKLKKQYSVIFNPLISQLQDLKNKKHTGNQQYMEIQKETAKLKEQLHVLARLKTKGFIDDEKYITQSTELSARIEKLNAELRKLSQADGEDEVIDQISEITAIIENGTDLMTQFDEVIFEGIVEKIIVINQNTLEFHLYGGLRFTEKIK